MTTETTPQALPRSSESGMNTRAVNAAAGVLLAAIEQGRQTPTGLALALDSACLLNSPEHAAETIRLRSELAKSLEKAAAAQLRVAELEKREAIVAEFVAKRAEYIVAIENCHPNNAHDYNRWQGHAESRRQLAGQLGLPVAWPSPAEADGITRRIAPTQALRDDEPVLTVFRASHDSIVMGLYTTAAEARKHCETELRRDLPTVELDWIEDDEDDVAELVASVGEDERVTGYVVDALEIASEYDEEADE